MMPTPLSDVKMSARLRDACKDLEIKTLEDLAALSFTTLWLNKKTYRDRETFGEACSLVSEFLDSKESEAKSGKP